ncbi:HLA class I histocompatibility antigen, Cw-3 alpha chain-like isoform X1 [Carassius auratus]|uniref:HLA class I histocompatibility antigen, Cw-3 alpha chain-like isoform X1 n=1 Tax=Carassius auratus TaxID=7957 RepID=A0A6P6MYL7_CARAU|nr:HLA class I histocompatibility antigen, Cw-3 alpha chain-like isoform X1 [Carassius auratus]
MFCLILLSLFICISTQSNAKPEKHSLHYKFTVLTKAGPFPAFSAVCESDHIQIARYRPEEQIWMRENLTEDAWDRAPGAPAETKDGYLDLIRILSNRTESSELHVLQRMSGCELEKLPDGAVISLKAFDEFAYDGKDFISCKYNFFPWMDKVIETEMNHQTGRNPFLKDFLINCTKWISAFNNTYKNSPDVGVFARKAPDDHSKLVLICLVTGFYPRDIEMNIRLDRTALGNQIFSEIRPNDDGSFQMRSSVKIDKNHRGSYDCHVIHSSLTEPVSAVWDGKCLNCDPDADPQAVTAGVAAAALFLIALIVIAYCVCKKKSSRGL